MNGSVVVFVYSMVSIFNKNVRFILSLVSFVNAKLTNKNQEKKERDGGGLISSREAKPH